MNGLGLAAPNRIRCQRAPVARPYRGSLRLRGLVVDNFRQCPTCGREFQSMKGLGGHVSKRADCRLPEAARRERRRMLGNERRYQRGIHRPQVIRSLEERFWDKVDRRGPDECWPWMGVRIPAGYGQLWHEGRHRPATHIALLLDGRPVPPDMAACHHCDNPPCVNPVHLFVGSYAENTKDSYRKGRSISPTLRRPDCLVRGEKSPHAKLTAAAVREIRECAVAGELHRKMALRFGVSRPTITAVVAHRSWRHEP